MERTIKIGYALGMSLLMSCPLAHGQDTVVIPCDGDPVPGTYCYTDNDEHAWHWQSDCGSLVFLQFVSGTIESSPYDHLRIYDGPDEMSPLIFQNPELPELQELTGLAVVSTSPHLYMRMTSNASNCCATNGLVASDWQPWEWTVSTEGGTGIKQIRTVDFRLYPNPAADRVHLEWLGRMEGEVLVRVVDGIGRTVRQESLVASPGNMGTMSLEGLGNGPYTVVISLPEGLVTHRLQVSR